ncbi:MAG: hypothetical protein PHR16_00030 [Methylovulum sp.]|nr:hypothetical protein [Methylovulum sp.]
MNEKRLGGFFFPAVAGLFFFLNKPKVEEAELVEYKVYSKDASGLTGVERYLENQQNNLKESDFTCSSDENISKSVVSGVAKYLSNRDQFPITGVTKYTIRLAIAQKQEKQKATQGNETGVAKYLKNKKSPPTVSSVARYLKHQESLPKISKVARYMVKKALAEKLEARAITNTEETGVAKYLKYQESLPQPSKVEKYMAKQALLVKFKKEQQIVVKFESTGVARYLKYKESLPQASKVAKYMARQAIEAKQNLVVPVMIETSVDRYMRTQR